MITEKESISSSSEYNRSLSKKIEEFDKKITEVDKTVDELFELTQKMLLNMGELK